MGVRTISIREMKSELVALRRKMQTESVEVANDDELGPPLKRPVVRGDCASVPRPCPFVSCKYNLYLDVNERGTIILNQPDKEPDEVVHSCALDLAEANQGMALREVGETLNITRERVRQIEIMVLLLLQESRAVERIRAALDDAPIVKNQPICVHAREEELVPDEADY